MKSYLKDKNSAKIFFLCKIVIVITFLPLFTQCDNPTNPDVNFVSQTIPLSAGWNWISLNVIPDDMSVSNYFSSVQENVIVVLDKQNDLSAYYSIDSGWTGDFVTVNPLLSYILIIISSSISAFLKQVKITFLESISIKDFFEGKRLPTLSI